MRKQSLKIWLFAFTFVGHLLPFTALGLQTHVCKIYRTGEPLPPIQSGSDPFMKFRANSHHYWAWSKKNAESHISKDVLKHSGVVVGDAHMGNIGDLIVSGHPRRITAIDLDDAGRGPFILDFTRYLLGARAAMSENEGVTRDLLRAYRHGLEGENVDVPKFVERALERDRNEINAEIEKYIEDSTKENRLIREKLGLLTIGSGPDRIQKLALGAQTAFQARFPELKILDVAYKIKNSGGSARMARFWLLVESSKGTRRIFEMKEMGNPGTSHYQNQSNPVTRLQEVVQTLWSLETAPGFGVIVADATPFWIRPRNGQQDLVFGPIAGLTKNQREDFEDWVPYGAYVLGRLHGSQSGSFRYKELLHEGDEKVLAMLKSFARAYQQALH